MVSDMISVETVCAAMLSGAGVPGSMRAEPRMVIETVTKSTTTTTTTQQQQQQQQQQQTFIMLQQQQATAVTAAVTAGQPLPVDASKVTASGNGLHQATVNQETSFIVDGSQSGQSLRHTHSHTYMCQHAVTGHLR